MNVLINIVKENIWLIPLISLIGGIISSFSPCCLSSIPLAIGAMGGGVNIDKRKSMNIAFSFFTGMVLTYTIMGVIISFIGNLFLGGRWWYIILGVLMFMMALQVWEVINIIPQYYIDIIGDRRGLIGAFLAGVAASIFSSPCSTPILVMILSLIAQQGNIILGTISLLLYSIGHGLLALLVGLGLSMVSKLKKSNKYIKLYNVTKVILGILMIILGMYMFSLGV